MPAPVGSTPKDVEPSQEPAIALEGLEFRSDHGLLKGCTGDTGWKDAGALCGEESWSPRGSVPISHSMGREVHLTLALRISLPEVGRILIRGKGPEGLRFRG